MSQQFGDNDYMSKYYYYTKFTNVTSYTNNYSKFNVNMFLYFLFNTGGFGFNKVPTKL